jgi:hypothetical protein
MSSAIGPPREDGHGVHVYEHGTSPMMSYTNGPVELNGRMFEDAVDTAIYADGTCETCRIALFRVAGTGPHKSTSHSHSADELISVIGGEIQLGRDWVRSGMTVAIPGDWRYGFRTFGPWEFINYRADASYTIRNPSDPPVFDGLAPAPPTTQ